MKEADLTGVHYIGADMVPELIKQNNETYGNEDREFKVLDVLEDELPLCDMVICRDALVHMDFRDCFRALRNITGSGAKYLLTTTFTLHENEEIDEMRMWRPLNMMSSPFNFGRPLVLLNEGNYHPMFCDKAVGVWRIEN